MTKQIIYLLVIASLISCKRNCGDPPANPPVIFHVVDHTHTINSNKVNLYWYADGILQRENELGTDYKSFTLTYPILNNANPRTYDSTRPLLHSLRMISAANQSAPTMFYLDYGNGQTDSLLVNVTRVATEDRHCVTVHYEVSGVYRGKPLARDTFDYGTYPVYLLNRD